MREELTQFSRAFASFVVMRWFNAGIEDDIIPKLVSIRLPDIKPIQFPVPTRRKSVCTTAK
jgi:hypothetical protein